MILITENGPINLATGKPANMDPIPRVYVGQVPEATGPAVRKVYYDASGNLVCEVLA